MTTPEIPNVPTAAPAELPAARFITEIDPCLIVVAPSRAWLGEIIASIGTARHQPGELTK